MADNFAYQGIIRFMCRLFTNLGDPPASPQLQARLEEFGERRWQLWSELTKQGWTGTKKVLRHETQLWSEFRK